MTDDPQFMDVEQYHALMATQSRKRSHYNAKSIIIDGHSFDSHAEANRYQELVLLQRAGDIQKLEPQPEFIIQERCQRWGKTIQQRKYTADFKYWHVEKDRWIVEDVKGGKRTKAGNIVPHVGRDFYLRFDLARFRYPKCDFEIVIR